LAGRRDRQGGWRVRITEAFVHCRRRPGEQLEVIWDAEIGPKVVGEDNWQRVGAGGQFAVRMLVRPTTQQVRSVQRIKELLISYDFDL
jgi:hypothetical protein